MDEIEIDPVVEFGTWLTTRDKVIEVGGAVDVYDMWEALEEFLAMKKAAASPLPQEGRR